MLEPFQLVCRWSIPLRRIFFRWSTLLRLRPLRRIVSLWRRPLLALRLAWSFKLRLWYSQGSELLDWPRTTDLHPLRSHWQTMRGNSLPFATCIRSPSTSKERETAEGTILASVLVRHWSRPRTPPLALPRTLVGTPELNRWRYWRGVLQGRTTRDRSGRADRQPLIPRWRCESTPVLQLSCANKARVRFSAVKAGLRQCRGLGKQLIREIHFKMGIADKSTYPALP